MGFHRWQGPQLRVLLLTYQPKLSIGAWRGATRGQHWLANSLQHAKWQTQFALGNRSPLGEGVEQGAHHASKEEGEAVPAKVASTGLLLGARVIVFAAIAMHERLVAQETTREPAVRRLAEAHCTNEEGGLHQVAGPFYGTVASITHAAVAVSNGIGHGLWLGHSQDATALVQWAR